jgi:hypothetical protein
VDVSLTCFDSLSPIHGAQDASHTSSTPSLLLRDTARRSACTCFSSHTCPFCRTLLMTCVTTWQFVNADALRILRRGLTTGRRLSFYKNSESVTARADPTVQTTDLPGNWQYSLCFAYVYFTFLARGLLTLVYSEPNATGRVFPYQVTFAQNNSAQNCLTRCSTYGYPAAGMENGDECCVCSTAVDRLRRRLRKC